MKKNKRGISLIVLIITIIVMLILVSVIVVSFNNNNPIGKANEAKFKADLSSFRDELDANVNDIIFGESNKSDMDINVNVGDYALLRKYIPDITEKYANKLLIKKGKLLYIGDDSGSQAENFKKYYNEQEENWARSIGIQSPYGQVGDTNGDGQITKEDSDHLKNMLGEGGNEVLINILTSRQKKAFDTNADGNINVNDSTTIDRYLDYSIDKLPYTGDKF